MFRGNLLLLHLVSKISGQSSDTLVSHINDKNLGGELINIAFLLYRYAALLISLHQYYYRYSFLFQKLIKST
jgi:hypothetical protein